MIEHFVFFGGVFRVVFWGGLLTVNSNSNNFYTDLFDP